MKILVTGGGGFIGHHVALKLQRLGHDVIIQDTFTNYGITDEKLMARLHGERLVGFKGKIIKSDITMGVTRTHIDIHKPDMIIHLASFPRAKIVNENPAEAVPTMTTGLMNLLVAGARNNVKRFVYISSSMVYGDFKYPAYETHATNPTSIYATLKLAGEQITKQFAKKHDFCYTIVRPSAVYGPRDVEDRVVSKFLLNAMDNKILNVNGEHESLDFSSVFDVSDGIVLAATEDAGKNETFNITYGQQETIAYAAHLMTTVVGGGELRICDRNPSMPSRAQLDISKARELLGYNPTISIEEGFKNYYEWAKLFHSIPRNN